VRPGQSLQVKMKKFKAGLDIIGINPFVFVPKKILDHIFKQAGKDKGYIPIRGTVNKNPYTQTLVRYKGEWRLYINTMMLKNSPKRIGGIIEVSVEYDDADRTIQPHSLLVSALAKNKKAKKAFEKLSPSRQKEIIRYIANLKTEESVKRNVNRAIEFLVGKTGFVGRKGVLQNEPRKE
jgi:hypothetical protein